jgi:hypothetical protein
MVTTKNIAQSTTPPVQYVIDAKNEQANKLFHEPKHSKTLDKPIETIFELEPNDKLFIIDSSENWQYAKQTAPNTVTLISKANKDNRLTIMGGKIIFEPPQKPKKQA